MAAANMSLSPVTVEDVAVAALRLAEERHRGIWHLAARDSIAYDEAARLMARICDFPAERVESEILTEAQVPAILRQRFTGLATGKIADRLGFPIRDARDVLTEIFGRYSDSIRSLSE